MRGTVSGALAVVLALGMAASPVQAQPKEVTIAHQDMVLPMRAAMDSGEIEKATGYKIDWRLIPTGADVIKAMAAGAVSIGEVGSSPAATAASQGLDILVFYILDDIGESEQLVARNGSGINSIKDVKGKKLATPFVSTSHYQLLFALEKGGVNPKDADIRNLRPPEIAAAWERGDIDAAFVWDPVLSKIKKNGKVLMSATDIAKMGRPTFDCMIVNKAWAEKNTDFLVKMIQVIEATNAKYKANRSKWTADSAEAKAVAKVTKADLPDVPAMMASYGLPTLEEEASKTWLGGGMEGGVAKALTDTANFLKEQGRVTTVQADYSKFVTDVYVKAAMKK
ncbi:MAG: taurine ABC transporter substrate-binding protein [Alphaproteobacteria bacterium]|nr:taurine ABC transporter substrate-binding protein [Alphaproteobacteria bacterium]